MFGKRPGNRQWKKYTALLVILELNIVQLHSILTANQPERARLHCVWQVEWKAGDFGLSRHLPVYSCSVWILKFSVHHICPQILI